MGLRRHVYEKIGHKSCLQLRRQELCVSAQVASCERPVGSVCTDYSQDSRARPLVSCESIIVIYQLEDPSRYLAFDPRDLASWP